MKKFSICAALVCALGSSAFALSIDSSSANSHFIGYKLSKKLGVSGEIQNGKYEFKKTEGSVKDILEGAKISLDFDNESTKDKTRDKNIHRTFNANLDDSKISVIFSGIKGDESSGEGKAKLTFNKVTKDIPVKYEVLNGKLKVSATIDMSKDFNLAKSYEALSTDKQISALHGKKTWGEVDIYFDVNVK